MRPPMWIPLARTLNPPSVIGRFETSKIVHLPSSESPRSSSMRTYSSCAALALSFDRKSITTSSMYRQYSRTPT